MEYEHDNEIKQEQSAPEEEAAPMTALTALSAKKRAPRLNAAPETPALPALPEEAPPADPNERVPVVDVQFRQGSKIYFFDPAGLPLKNGDHVILDTSRGAEFGYCVLGVHRIARRELVQPLRRVLRMASAIDERIKAENERREKEAYAFCLRKIEELGLDMQLVSVECAFDGGKLLFFFTADARVDFRELVRILASNFHTRIELRQIGVRDKAKMLGGLGICGRPFCCASFLEEFQPVSIKMAKTQNLSLNPTKISGTCGRLMCCLKYEQDAYEDLIRSCPKAESFVDTPDGRGTVTSVNLMRQSVSVRMEKDDEEIRSYRNEEICVLRSGKAKKNDPPIPEDLAPISGRRDGELLERRPFPDRRLTVDPDEEPEIAPLLEPDPPTGEPRPGKRNRRERNPEQPAPVQQAEAQPAPEKKPERRGQRKKNRPAQSGQEKPDRPELSERVERVEPAERTEPQLSRQQRRRQRQGKPEPKLPQPKLPQAEQPRRPVLEKRPEEQSGPKPETAKKNNRRRYYHNRKPKG